MKPFQRLCMAIVLTLTLTMSAFAEGHMDTPKPSTPPGLTSAPMQGDIEITRGHMETGSGATETAASFTQAALNLLEGVLSLF
jgi:hypothetical protein